MKTTRFGFGSTAQDTHLDVRRSVAKNALAVASPAFLCLLVTACAILQPYSAEDRPGQPLLGASANTNDQSSDTCTFGDTACIASQSAFQEEQAGFLARQYPLILKNAQRLAASRQMVRTHAQPEAQAHVNDLAMRIQVMTSTYNFHAARTDPDFLSARHLPAKIVP